MTKTEYREYIASGYWQNKRKEVLRQRPECERCRMSRNMSVHPGVYDQDLHVHHRNYAHLGRELDEDLEVLCAQCHEMEIFGSSSLGWGVWDFIPAGAERLQRSAVFAALVMEDYLEAAPTQERFIEFWQVITKHGLTSDEIDLLCLNLCRNCIAWPLNADFETAVSQLRDQEDRLASKRRFDSLAAQSV